MSRLVLLLSSLLALLAACTPKPSPGAASEPPAVVMQGVRLRSYDGSTLTLTGQAERATYHRSGDLSATQATLHSLDKGQQPGKPGVTTVSARLMEGNLGSRQMVASGDVVLRTASGTVAYTPRVTYDGVNQSAKGNEGVRIEGPDYGLTAKTFSLSLPDDRFTFEGSVETVLGAARD
ncbi:LPS export ABC transporter periplasmic protein LptC [Archangium sp.]|uniref:LPS export ABC transporter periplasmic protein LptC n=1 Tax=Archangium sp. TaxID=1872627 RepID=UPI00286D4BAD|nr:LPS export ABC transporter periplasmic protein LptC [Archangium sp.]